MIKRPKEFGALYSLDAHPLNPPPFRLRRREGEECRKNACLRAIARKQAFFRSSAYLWGRKTKAERPFNFSFEDEREIFDPNFAFYPIVEEKNGF